MVDDLRIHYWLNYFSNKGIYLDIDKARELLKEIRKGLREDEVNRGEYVYMKGMLDNLLMSSRDYLVCDFLDIGSFMRSYKGKRVKVYSDYKVGETYRLFSSNPSLGNLNRRLRNLITCEEDKYLVKLDYRNQEPWIIANLLDNEELKEFASGDDFYKGLMARFGVSDRSRMKEVWNASIYGSQLSGLGDEVWIREVYEWINSLEEVKSLRSKVKDNLKEGKEIYTIFGLSRVLRHEGRRSELRGFNSIFQMTGSGILYKGLDSIESTIIFKGYQDLIAVFLTNHDEYVLEVSKNIPRAELEAFLSEIDFSIEGWSLPSFDVSYGNSWGSCD